MAERFTVVSVSYGLIAKSRVGDGNSGGVVVVISLERPPRLESPLFPCFLNKGRSFVSVSQFHCSGLALFRPRPFPVNNASAALLLYITYVRERPAIDWKIGQQ